MDQEKGTNICLGCMSRTIHTLVKQQRALAHLLLLHNIQFWVEITQFAASKKIFCFYLCGLGSIVVT
jgi:hypothetical protein